MVTSSLIAALFLYLIVFMGIVTKILNFMKNVLTTIFLLVAAAQYSVAQNQLNAELTVDLSSAPQEYSPMIFGQFIEHFHRQIYGGIFEPGSKLSDEQGFRKDVIQALRDLKVPVVRWPGGCFVSSYHWLKGVGENRIPVYDKAWHVEEPNTFGTDEYIDWCIKIGAEPYICTNAGTGSSVWRKARNVVSPMTI